MTAPANKRPHTISQQVTCSARATGIVFDEGEGASNNANKNSFQENIYANIIVAINPGAERGKVILINAPKEEHPSINAASSISRGISKKKPLIIQIINGSIKEMYARTKDHSVLSKLYCFIIK